ncbi:P-II family nitrogen regulator [Thalassobacillus pellis]|uniref:P-II family nitrogen regulator n=1 Tax=Thalassobacillus pellis TaxID=748008 RepID=UPI001960E9D8|nr:P-II family nitrogen regulator [Thalassobacillus pellis]MBM7553982.1 nitrogen regulatory protein PII [Thalassobacillus pellis]
MSNSSDIAELELIYVIVDLGLGSKVVQTAKKHGISGGTVLLGKGTLKSRLLELLGINDVRKEIVMMASDRETANYAIEQLDKKFKFTKKHQGIAFTISVGKVIGARSYKDSHVKEGRGADNMRYHAITVIVEKGNAEEVISAATEAGSKGGTIINARGSGIHETSKVFSMDIEPEKEIVLILSEKEATEEIVASIRKKLKIDEPGNGIIFIQDVNNTYGLYK